LEEYSCTSNLASWAEPIVVGNARIATKANEHARPEEHDGSGGQQQRIVAAGVIEHAARDRGSDRGTEHLHARDRGVDLAEIAQATIAADQIGGDLRRRSSDFSLPSYGGMKNFGVIYGVMAAVMAFAWGRWWPD